MKRPASEQGQGKEVLAEGEKPSCVSVQRELMSSSTHTKTGHDEEQQQVLVKRNDAAKTGSLQDGSNPCSNTKIG